MRVCGQKVESDLGMRGNATYVPGFWSVYGLVLTVLTLMIAKLIDVKRKEDELCRRWKFKVGTVQSNSVSTRFWWGQVQTKHGPPNVGQVQLKLFPLLP